MTAADHICPPPSQAALEAHSRLFKPFKLKTCNHQSSLKTRPIRENQQSPYRLDNSPSTSAPPSPHQAHNICSLCQCILYQRNVVEPKMTPCFLQGADGGKGAGP